MIPHSHDTQPVANLLLFRRGWDDRDLWLLCNRAAVGAGNIIFFIIIVRGDTTVARADVLASSSWRLLSLCSRLLAHVVRISTKKANLLQKLKPTAQS